MKAIRSIAAVALALSLSFCAATPKLDTTRPITTRGNLFLGESYEQSGERLDMVDMWGKLEADATTGEDVRNGSRWALASGLLATGGVICAGLALAEWDNGRPLNWTATGAGAGLIAIAIPMNYLASRSYSRAVAAYNDKLGYREDARTQAEADDLERTRAPFRWTAQIGLDFGSKEMAWAQWPNGERRSLALNDGFALRFGGTFSAFGPFETELRLGIKTWSIGTSDDHVRWLSIPIDALEAVNLGPFRVAVGVALHPWPLLIGSGRLASIDAYFDSAVGPLAEVRFQTTLTPLRRGVPFTSSYGVRYEWLSLSMSGRPALAGSAIGVFSQTAF